MASWRVERQQPSECLLATLAALSGRRYGYVRAQAKHYLRRWYAESEGYIPAECTWRYNAIGNHPAYKCVADQLSHLLGLPTISFSAIPTAHSWEIPDRGQGYIRVKTSQGSHIMPWRDGLIYDVGADNPMDGVTLEVYLAKYSGEYVLGIETLGE